MNTIWNSDLKKKSYHVSIKNKNYVCTITLCTCVNTTIPVCDFKCMEHLFTRFQQKT